MFFYLHIPFCRQKCLYCKFALTSRFDDLKIETYVRAMKREIWDFLDAHPHVTVESIYFGGGTPSILSSSQIAKILEVFRTHSFSSIIEITMEANPEDITPGYLEAISALGVNRLSLGVQTLNDQALATVGRSPSSVAMRALDTLVCGPIENISLDLIAGLPHVKKGQILSDLGTIFDHITPKHVSIYMLEDEAYPSDWIASLPGEEAIREEYLSGMNYLQERGFRRYELSNFGQACYESRHNRAYWNHSESRGFGLSAASFVGGVRSTNSASFSGYYRHDVIQDGTLSEESLRIERIMFGMRTA